MRFSFRYLAKLANLPATVDVEQVAKVINRLGFEVESITPFGNFSGLKVGQVLSTEPNTNSDNLTICKIRFADQVRTIQTTATNVVVNAKVIAFVPGATTGSVTFGPRKLKGVISEGMMASITELGISADLARSELATGILILPTETPLELDVIEWLALNDFILDVTVLTNRADANSYWSMALELAAYFQTKMTLPKAPQKAPINSQVIATNGAAKSLAFVEGEVDFEISLPDQFLLAKAQLKSINNLVDLTNLILIMTGQPAHAYDLTQLTGKLSADYYQGSLEVLGKKSVTLNQHLVIKSGNEPVSIGGVIGLAKYGVKKTTKRFLIELGRFNIADVRQSAHAVKLATVAASQSSRDLSAALTHWAYAYLTHKVKRYSQLINAPLLPEVTIAFDKKAISEIIGDSLFFKSDYWTKARKSLNRLGYQFKANAVQVASHILNVTSSQDLAEEIMRFCGYEILTPQAPQLINLTTTTVNDLANKSVSAGYQEVMTYSLVSAEEATFNPWGFKNTISLATFVSTAHTHIRNSVIPALLAAIDYQAKRKLPLIDVFELAYVNDSQHVLALASSTKSFQQMQRDIINITGLALEFKRSHNDALHTGLSADIWYQNQLCGFLGKVHPGRQYFDAWVAELTLPALHLKPIFVPSHEQLITRDITISLNIREEIATHLLALQKMPGVQSLSLIDTATINNKVHVTIRVGADSSVIAQIDRLYNN